VLEIGGVQVDEETKRALAAQKNRWYVERISTITPAEILPGVLPLLAHLRARGMPIALPRPARTRR